MRIYACICAHAPRDRRIRIQPYMYIYRYTGARPHWRAYTYTPVFADMSVNGRAHPRTDVYIYTPICIYAGIRAHTPIGVRIRRHLYMHICWYTGARVHQRAYTYTPIYAYMPVYGRTRSIGVRMRIPICMHMHVYAHTCRPCAAHVAAPSTHLQAA